MFAGKNLEEVQVEEEEEGVVVVVEGPLRR